MGLIKEAERKGDKRAVKRGKRVLRETEDFKEPISMKPKDVKRRVAKMDAERARRRRFKRKVLAEDLAKQHRFASSKEQLKHEIQQEKAGVRKSGGKRRRR